MLRDHWLALCLLPSCLPLLVFAYLGTFSRIIADDYCFFGTGQDLGAWESVLHWRANWNGHYSNVFLHGLIAPVGTDAVRIFPALIILLWLFGFFFLAQRALSCAGVEKQRITIVVALAGALVSTTINASFWQQVIFWYASSVPYSLPYALLTIYAGLIWELVIRNEGQRLPKPLIAASALFCFLNAGFAALYMVVQLGIFTLAMPAALAFVPERARRHVMIIIGSGWLATIASLLVQLSAPGVAIRADAIAAKWGVPDRSLSSLLSRTAEELFAAAHAPELLAGILIMLALGMLLALTIRLRDQPLNRLPFRLSRAALVLGLGIQLLFLPLLWTYTSDLPQLLGRFSSGYASVIVVNASLILIFALLALAVHRINAMLLAQDGAWLIVPIATMLIVAMLFAMTQVRSIHWRASAYLFFTIQLLLLVLVPPPLPAAKSRRFAAFAVWAYVSAWAVTAPAVFASVHTLPVVPERVYTVPFAMSFLLNGLLWGVFLGFAIRRYKLSTLIGNYGLRLMQMLCLVLLLVISIGIAIGQAGHVPLLAGYAEEWDERHREIVTQLKMGEEAFVVKPLKTNLREFMRQNASGMPCSEDYFHAEVLVTD
ncbi:MAG: hypothetical protein OXG84_18195 [Chloroflexi bacterium]|nr:hypothetical protein [Chloroflexota bacterium]